jgi:cobalamin biosynthetic protein CobC
MARPIAHGGGLIAARRRYPDAPEPWIDLSTGINPVPYPVPPLPLEAFTRLPEPEQVAALEAVAATAYGVGDPAMLVAAPGTQSLIHLLPRLIPARRVAVVGPTYAEHAAAWALAACDVRTVGSLDEADGADVVVVCNPNNPDGRVFAPSALAGVGGMLVVDAAFGDFSPRSPPSPPPSCAGLTRAPPWHEVAGSSPAMTIRGNNEVIALRSFGKTYGLAGIRLGFAITAPAMAARIREALGPWAVSGPALHVGTLALADTAWRHAAADRLAKDGARLDMMLRDAGCALVGGTHLFRLVAHPNAAGLADRLAHRGILVRQFDYRPDWLRFGIPGDEAAWRRLGSALRSC